MINGDPLWHVSAIKSLTNSSSMSKINGHMVPSILLGRRLDNHGRHCVVVLEQDTFILASTGSTQVDPSLFN